MCHDLIRNVQTSFDSRECGISSSCESSELQVIVNSSDASICAIRSFVDHCVDILREGRDEASLGRRTRDLERTQPKSIQTRIVRKACNIHQDINLLSCNFTKRRLLSWALFVGVSDSIHDHVGVKACAITIDFVGELVVYVKESHKIAGYSNTI